MNKDRMEIFVVTIEPQGGGVGGVEWRTTRDAANTFMDELAHDLDEMNDRNLLSLWRTEVPAILTPAEITDYVYDGFVTNDPDTSAPGTFMVATRGTGHTEPIYIDVLTGSWGPAVGVRILTPTDEQDQELMSGAGDTEIMEIGETGSPVITHAHLLKSAFGLLGDGAGDDWSDNTEYTRAIYELVADALGMDNHYENGHLIEAAIREANGESMPPGVEHLLDGINGERE